MVSWLWVVGSSPPELLRFWGTLCVGRTIVVVAIGLVSGLCLILLML